MKQALLLLAAGMLACQPSKAPGTPVVTVDTLIRIDTTHQTDTVSITKSVHDTVRVPVHDTVITRLMTHDTVLKMVTTIDSVPVHDTLRVTVAIHDTTFVPRHDTVTVRLPPVHVTDTLLKTTQRTDTLLKTVYDTVFRTDSILYTVITQARMDVLQHTVDSLKARPMGSAVPPYVNCVLAEGVYYQGGADSVIYVPVLGDPDRVAMWTAEHINGADQSYGPALQVCMDNFTFAKSKKALVASHGPGLSMQKVGADSEMVIQGLPGPSNSLRLMLFSRGTLLKMVYGIPGHPTSEWAQGLDLLLNKPSPEQK